LPLLSFDQKILKTNSLLYLNKQKEKDNILIKIIIQSKQNKQIFIEIGPINIPINLINYMEEKKEIEDNLDFNNEYLGRFFGEKDIFY